MNFYVNASNVRAISPELENKMGVRWLRPRKTILPPDFFIDQTKPVGTTPFLTGFITGLGIFNAAQSRLRELHYSFREGKPRKKCCAVGWQNEAGGWQLATANWTGNLGPKGLSIIPGDSRSLAIFQNYFDYLAWTTLHPKASHTVLVLNYLSMLDPAIYLASYFEHVALFFTADQQGDKLSHRLIRSVPHALDQRPVYKGYSCCLDKVRAVQQPFR